MPEKEKGKKQDLTLEDLQVQMLDVQKVNKDLLLKVKALTEDVETKNTKIQKLQESNQDLFLRASQGYQQQEKEQSQEPEKWVSQLAGDYADYLDQKQLKELEEIEQAIFE